MAIYMCWISKMLDTLLDLLSKLSVNYVKYHHLPFGK